MILAIYKSPQYFLSSFESMGLSVQEKSSKQIFKMAIVVAILYSDQNN